MALPRDLRHYRLTLGQLSRAIGGDQRRARGHLAAQGGNGKWLVEAVSRHPGCLRGGGPGTPAPTSGGWTGRPLPAGATRLAGVGCHGVLVELSHLWGEVGSLRAPDSGCVSFFLLS